jgi:hypothetical protein
MSNNCNVTSVKIGIENLFCCRDEEYQVFECEHLEEKELERLQYCSQEDIHIEDAWDVLQIVGKCRLFSNKKDDYESSDYRLIYVNC